MPSFFTMDPILPIIGGNVLLVNFTRANPFNKAALYDNESITVLLVLFHDIHVPHQPLLGLFYVSVKRKICIHVTYD